jgi:hypothetical protein
VVLPVVASSILGGKQRERASTRGSGSERKRLGWLLHAQNTRQDQLDAGGEPPRVMVTVHCGMDATSQTRCFQNVRTNGNPNFPGLYLSMHTFIAQSPLLNGVELRESDNTA